MGGDAALISWSALYVYFCVCVHMCHICQSYTTLKELFFNMNAIVSQDVWVPGCLNVWMRTLSLQSVFICISCENIRGQVWDGKKILPHLVQVLFRHSSQSVNTPITCLQSCDSDDKISFKVSTENQYICWPLTVVAQSAESTSFKAPGQPKEINQWP